MLCKILLKQDAHCPHNSLEIQCLAINKLDYKSKFIQEKETKSKKWCWSRFLKLVNAFSLFHYYITPKKVWSLIGKIFNPLHPRMHCDKLGLNKPSGSGKDF